MCCAGTAAQSCLWQANWSATFEGSCIRYVGASFTANGTWTGSFAVSAKPDFSEDVLSFSTNMTVSLFNTYCSVGNENNQVYGELDQSIPGNPQSWYPVVIEALLPDVVGVDIGEVYVEQSTYSGLSPSCSPLPWANTQDNWTYANYYFGNSFGLGQLPWMAADAGSFSFSGPLDGMTNGACYPEYTYEVMWNMQATATAQ
jgi:hypothetical protein